MSAKVFLRAVQNFGTATGPCINLCIFVASGLNADCPHRIFQEITVWGVFVFLRLSGGQLNIKLLLRKTWRAE